jgi:hypothetical protein
MWDFMFPPSRGGIVARRNEEYKTSAADPGSGPLPG